MTSRADTFRERICCARSRALVKQALGDYIHLAFLNR